MLDGYVLNLGRCVNATQEKFFGIKSHDYHVSMECMLPTALRELSDHVWRLLIELSKYFRYLSSSTLSMSLPNE